MTDKSKQDPPANCLVPIGSRLDSSSIEDALVRFDESVVSARSCRFDLADLTWCEPFALTMLLFWIHELSEAGRDVSVFLPSSSRVRAFLDRYGFTDALPPAVRRSTSTVSSPVPRLPSLPIPTPFFPLTRLTEEVFRSLLEGGAAWPRLDRHFGTSRFASLPIRGALRDVILDELGDNAFRHGEGRLVHLLMTKLTAPGRRSLEPMLSHTDRQPHRFELEYLSKLDGAAYFEVVLGDMGPGIPATLRPKLESPPTTDHLLLQRAFEYGTSSRTIAERVGELLPLLAADDSTTALNQKLLPATGLFRVRETLRALGGFVYVRSGTGFAAYDYFGPDPKERSLPQDASSSHPPRAFFKGTHYRILVPADRPSWLADRQRRRPVTTSSRPASAPDIHLRLSDFVRPSTDHAQRDELAAILAFLEELDRRRHRSSVGASSVLLDLYSPGRFSAKGLYLLAHNAMAAQRPVELAVITALPPDTARQIAATVPERYFCELENAAGVIADTDAQLYLYTRDARLRAASDTVLHGRPVSAEEPALLEAATRSLFAYDALASQWQLGPLLCRIPTLVRDAVKGQLATILESDGHGVWRPRAQVLLPIQYYCQGYFDLTALRGDRSFSELALRWIALWIRDTRTDTVVTIGDFVSDLVRGAFPVIRHIALRTGLEPPVTISPLLGLPSDSRVLVVGGVIASGRGFHSVREVLRDSRIVASLAFVKTPSVTPKLFPHEALIADVEAVVTCPIRFYSDLPPNWLYKDVLQVDPMTHALVAPELPAVEYLWKDGGSVTDGAETSREARPSALLDEVLGPANAIRRGHYVSAPRHMTYLFDAPAIIDHFGEAIKAVIVAHTNRRIANMRGEHNVTDIVYPVFNPGVDLLAALLSTSFPRAVVRTIERNGVGGLSLLGAPSSEAGIVLLLDDVLETGHTLLDMLEACADLSPELVLYYSVIRRATHPTGGQITNVTRYRHMHVEVCYLSGIEVPTYRAEDCPACREARRWEYLLDQVGPDSPLAQVCRMALSELTAIPVDALRNEESERPLALGNRDALRSLEYTWRLILAQTAVLERHYLMNLVRHGDIRDRSTAVLLRVIASEMRPDPLALDNDPRFYRTFREVLGKKAMEFLLNSEHVTDDQLDACFIIAINCDRDLLFRRLPTVLRKLFRARRGMRVMALLARHPEFLRHSGRISTALRRSGPARAAEPQLATVIADVLAQWQALAESASNQGRSGIAAYRRLRTAGLHELDNLHEAVVGEVAKVPLDPRSFGVHYVAFSEHVRQHILPNMRDLAEGGVSPFVKQRLADSADAIDVLLQQGDNSFDPAAVLGTSAADTVDGSGLATLLLGTSDKVRALLSPEDGVQATLGLCSIDVKTVLAAVLAQRRTELDRAGITVTRDYMDDPCRVFCEDGPLREVCQNVVRNVIRHSGASRMGVRVRTNKRKGQVTIEISDDGRGNSGPLLEGDGIRICRTLLRRYGGHINVRGRFTARASGMHATITLHYVGERG